MNVWKKTFLLAVSHFLIAFAGVSQTTQAQGTADIAVVPQKNTVISQDTLQVAVRVQAGKQPVLGAMASLTFDPSVLKVIRILPGNTLPSTLTAVYDNDKGTLMYAAGTFSNLPTDTFELSKIQFKVVGSKNVTIGFNTVADNPAKTDIVYYEATSVLKTTYPATVQVVPNVPPVAHAGDDIELVDENRRGAVKVRLDGSRSTDSDGSIISYVWRANNQEIATGMSPEVTFPAGQTRVVLTVTDNRGATATDELMVTIHEPDNKAPLAHAGPDQQLTTGSKKGEVAVQLDGSASSDADGSIASYSWLIEQQEVASGVKPVIQLKAGVHAIVLKVTDDRGLSSTDQVTITVQDPANQLPVAHAGADQDLTDKADAGFLEVALNGAASYDPDGTIEQYAWQWAFGTASGVNPLVRLSTGIHTIVLTVTDDGGATANDTVQITIRKPNQKPLADAGKDITLEDKDNDGKESVQLDGSQSVRGSAPIVTYRWSTAEGEIARGMQPSVDVKVGRTKITLTIIDEDGHEASDEVFVTLLPYNAPPVAHAGANQTVEDTKGNGKVTVTLDGSASTDADGLIAQYSWTYEGLQAAVSGVKPALEMAVGVTRIVLTVTDDRGATASDTVTVTVLAKNQLPVAMAGDDQQLIDEDANGEERVLLDGSASYDPDGTIVQYEWYNRQQRIATGKTASVMLKTGTHPIRLLVKDNRGASSSDTVVVEVLAPLGVTDEQEGFSEISIFPNPSERYFTILAPAGLSLNYVVLDMQGKIVGQNKMSQGKAVLDLSQYPKGVYVLKLQAGQRSMTQKLIVK